MAKSKFLRKRTESYVYTWTPKLALRPDMVACDEKGNLLRSVPTLSIATTDIDEDGNEVATETHLQTNITPTEIAKMRKDDLISYADTLGVEYDPMAATVASLRHDILQALRGEEE